MHLGKGNVVASVCDGIATRQVAHRSEDVDVRRIRSTVGSGRDAHSHYRVRRPPKCHHFPGGNRAPSGTCPQPGRKEVVAQAGSRPRGIPQIPPLHDAVCVGQAFHWFEPGAALGEVARILRPGGWLALIWNLWDLDDPSQAALDRIVSPLATGRIRPLTTGNHPYGGWSEALARDPRFAQAATARFAHTVELDAQAAGERVASVSQVQSAPPAERDAAVARARALVAGLPGGRGSFRYQTEVEIRRRAPT